MEMTLIEKTGQTRIKVGRKAYDKCESVIASYIAVHGGRKEKESSRYLYFIIDADLLNRK